MGFVLGDGYAAEPVVQIEYGAVVWVGKSNYLTWEGPNGSNSCKYFGSDKEECFKHLLALGIKVHPSSDYPIHQCWSYSLYDNTEPPELHPLVAAFYDSLNAPKDNESALDRLQPLGELEEITYMEIKI